MSTKNPLYHDWIAVVMFALLMGSLYYFARRPMDSKEIGSPPTKET